MYSVYFNNKVINFRQFSEPLGADDYIMAPGERIDITKVLQKIENNKVVTLLSEDVEQLFVDFCALFRVAEAAGGLVRDGQQRVLMIFRNGCWDLPKGHLESGESLEFCAAREVSEECGITGMKVGHEICCTMHIYRLDDEWVLKRSHWYTMVYRGSMSLVPQIEEGIERVEWLDENQVRVALENSYSTIKMVFKYENNEK